ncbi:MAG: N-6 DNA methylase, partial [Planctomycetota bacterium]|nr:N-6 DNA methylase [Planctomycetota bacterium]
GTTTVDKEFLAEIEGWRDELAKNIAIRNGKLSVYDLNFAVQKTIDRILFLRICEDRGIERSEQLLGLINGSRIYPRLFELFEKSDERYNSGIFHFRREKDRPQSPDELSANLKVDDDVLKKIIKDLYYPCPYEFSIMPAEILGNVYEQFLGKVIRLTASHQAKVEEKPEVKKAGGVYYTPSYIVDYIVKNTVGKLCGSKLATEDTENTEKINILKTPAQIAKLRILDPACGSGSFLIGAYQYLLDFHRDYYAKEPSKHKKVIYQGKGGQWFLTIDEKKRILLNNIYGVDIDSQAVEVTKLSLLLKVLENETQESLRLFHERALPDLGNNIKCGNSLIEHDFYENQLFDNGQQDKIRAFDWQKEFAPIFKQGGFDAVIGNPPYVFGRNWKALNITDEVKTYLSGHYKTSPYQMDMFSIFMEKAFLLSKTGGYVGEIVPNVWLTNTYSSVTRAFFFSHSQEVCIAVPPPDVFPGITVDTIVYTFKKSDHASNVFITTSIAKDAKEFNPIKLKTAKYADGTKPISTAVSPKASDLVESLKNRFTELGSLASITRGVHPYRLGGYGQTAYGTGPQTQKDLDNRPYHNMTFKKGFRPFIYGHDLKRYGYVIPQEYVKYGMWLAEPRDPKFFEGERIYSRKILAERLVVTLERENSVADQQVYITKPDKGVNSQYLLGVLGSRLMAFFIRAYFDEATKAFPQIKVTQLKMLPIKTIDTANKTDNTNHDKMVSLVDEMLELHKKINTIKNPDEKTRIQRQIDSTDGQIDNLVYELYVLTPAEIAIVEGTEKSN